MKVILELSPRALRFLKNKADGAKRSRKNYMELVLTIHAAMMEERPPTPTEVNEYKSKPSNKK